MSRFEPYPERLIVLKLCEGLGPVLASEEATRQAAERINKLGETDSDAAWTANSFLCLVKLAIHSVLYAIDRDTLVEACDSSGGLPPEGLDLPPLPFTNIIVEADKDEVWPLAVDDNDPHSSIEVFWISEIEQGKRWDAVLFMRDEQRTVFDSGDHPWVAHAVEISPKGSRPRRDWPFHPTWTDEDYTEWRKTVMWRFLVEAAHFITANGVSWSGGEIRRSDRRRAQKQGYSIPARLYWHRIESEQDNSVNGKSDREYHCRWLVRGHWRHLSDRKTWVKSYIKGPPGKPWRGRPMYHVPR